MTAPHPGLGAGLVRQGRDRDDDDQRHDDGCRHGRDRCAGVVEEEPEDQGDEQADEAGAQGGQRLVGPFEGPAGP